MQFCVTDEWSYVIKHCDRCQSTDILVGQSEVDSRYCDSCLEIDTIRDKTKRDAMTDAWDKIRPSSRDYPKRVEPSHQHEDLPPLSVGERSALALTLPFVTVIKNHVQNKRLRQESITVESTQFQQTVTHLLPRTDLKTR